MAHTRRILIDDGGRVWTSGSYQVRVALHAVGGEFDLVDYALRNLGFIELVRADTRVRLRLRPRVLADMALAVAVHMLADDPPARVALSWLGAEWRDEIYGDWRAAVQRIVDLAMKAKIDASNAFLLRPGKADALAAEDPLAELLRRWRALAGGFNPETLVPLLRATLRDRYVIAVAGPGRSALTLLSVGAGFLSYDAAWRRVARGQRMEDQPDVYYGRWVAQTYREALAADAPRVDEVDAVINRPGLGHHRVQYRRLIVPIRLGSGVTGLLGASVLDPRIDLRVEA